MAGRGPSGKLTALDVKHASKRGYLSDGNGLYLQVNSATAKSWVFRYRGADRRLRELGLGSTKTVSLSDAREAALDCRRSRQADKDPILERRSAKTKARSEAARSTTFRDCALLFVENHAASWSNPKHAKQWVATLTTYAFPFFGDIPISEIDRPLVKRALDPIWLQKIETADRLRGRIESVLSYAIASGLREGPNPARWKDNLEHVMAARPRTAGKNHFAALPYQDMGSFWPELNDQNGVAASALKFLILTASRTQEALGARWSELDFANAIWRIPAYRMKARTDHNVPLSSAVLQLLEDVERIRRGDYLFPGGKVDKPLSNMAMTNVLRRMGRDAITVHGFRSTFRDWAGEKVAFPEDVMEKALAHATEQKVKGAYARSDLLEKRRELMAAWATYCTEPLVPSGKVIRLRPGQAPRVQAS